ncbi:DUF58 domain-containing protein [Halosegnis longus]|uniref:DUF58 domain-containing protein n=1 Tax=Halosegnis longus TaxID=2216012 RepID=UPI0013566BF6|nr:DUF58 domain-containing protein [Salella cibi]
MTLTVVLVAVGSITTSVGYLIGAIGLIAVIFGQQYYLIQVTRTVQTAQVTQSLTRQHISAGETVKMEISVTLSEPAPVPIEITPILPVGLESPPSAVTVAVGETEATDVVSLSAHVAGAFTIESPSVSLTTGVVSETLRVGNQLELLVEPQSPRQLHIGAGGDEIAAAYGDHSAERGGSGTTPAELRQYVPGDPAARIDWKATARLSETYVREFEAQTDRPTILVNDCRSSLAAGDPGHRKADYLRDVLLSLAAVSQRANDPLGVLTIDETGIVQRTDPDRSTAQYQAVRTTLQESTPTTLHNSQPPATQDVPETQSVMHLRGDDSRFGQTLQPYFASVSSRITRVREQPLFDSVNQLSDGEEQRLVVIATDDQNRAELHESVKLLSQRKNQVLVFITPTALFEAYTLANLEETYESYVSFEEFRSRLNRLPRVQAFEVGSGDRIENVLAAGRQRRGVAYE